MNFDFTSLLTLSVSLQNSPQFWVIFFNNDSIHNIDTNVIIINTLMCFVKNCLMNFEKKQIYKNKVVFLKKTIDENLSMIYWSVELFYSRKDECVNTRTYYTTRFTYQRGELVDFSFFEYRIYLFWKKRIMQMWKGGLWNTIEDKTDKLQIISFICKLREICWLKMM